LRKSKRLKFLGDGFLEYQAEVRCPFVMMLKLAYVVHILAIVPPEEFVLKQVRFAWEVGVEIKEEVEEKMLLQVFEAVVVLVDISEHHDIQSLAQEDITYV
jgi:hypothetical protein